MCIYTYIYINVYYVLYTLHIIYVIVNNLNKIGLSCIKCLTVADNSSNIELKYEIDGMVSLYSDCVDYGFKKIAATDGKDLNYYLENLAIKKTSL